MQILSEPPTAKPEISEKYNSPTNKLYLSEYGTAGKVYALGIQGDQKFQTETFNFLQNYGVIGETAQFHPMFDNFGYCVVERELLYHGLVCLERNLYWINKRCSVQKNKNTLGKRDLFNWQSILDGAGRYYYKHLANKAFSSIIEENFMQYLKATDNHYFRTGSIKAKN